MRAFIPTLLAATLLALPASATGTPLSAEDFEAYTTGKTLTYSQRGAIYGAEQYLPGRKVRWAFKGEECREGQWYEENGQICFVYPYDPTPQCWTFWHSDGKLHGLFDGDLPGSELSETTQTTEPLICAGPDVGV